MAMFDTLSASRRLREVGFEEKQADAVVGLLAEDVSGNIATKSDIEMLRAATKSDIELLKAATESDIESLRADTKSEFELFRAEVRALEQRMTIRLGGLVAVATGIIIAVIALTA